jgi:DNA repair exonuclease SbcCD ATPase subunit
VEEKGQEERQLIRIEEMSLEETQLAEQLYNSAGLDPVVDAGLKDYGKRLQQEDKLISKVLGPRGSDIRGYGEAVAKRVSFAIYTLLNRQYGGKVGDLRSYIMTLQEERDGANARYDELLGRVVGILGEEYRELRTDSKAFMERLTGILGEDIKESRIDHKALAERLADIDGLRSQITTLEAEKEQLKESYESQIAVLRNERTQEVENLRSQIAALDSEIKGLQSEKATLISDLAQLRGDHNQLKTAITTLAGAIAHEEIGEKLAEELYAFLLKDSKVPGMVIEGVGKFVNFKKYLGLAAVEGAKEATKQAEEVLRNALSK